MAHVSYIISAKSKHRSILYFFGPFATREEADITWADLEAHPDWTPDEMPALNSIDTLSEDNVGPQP